MSAGESGVAPHGAGTPGRPSGLAAALRENLTLAVLIFACLAFGRFFASAVPAGVAWPLLGLNLGALGRYGMRVLPGVLLGSALAVAPFGALTPAAILATFAAAILPALVAAPLMRPSLANGGFCLSMRGAVLLVTLGGGLAAGLAALANFALNLASGQDMSQARDALPGWWIGNASAVMLVTPLFCRGMWDRRAAANLAPGAVAALALVGAAIASVSFGPFWSQAGDYQLHLLLVPLLVWGAIRLTGMAAQIAALAFAVSALVVTAVGHGLDSAAVAPEVLFNLHLFVMVAAALVLLVHGNNSENQFEQARLLASEQHFRTLVHASCDVYWNLDANLRFTHYADLRQAAPNRVEDAEVYGLHPWELPGREALSAGWESMQRTLEAHEPFRDFMLRFREGPEQWRYLRVAGAPVFDAGGQFAGYRGLAQDASEQMRAQDEVQRSQFELRALLDASPDWVVMKNRSGEWLVANQAIMTAFSLRESDWRGRSPDELLLVAPQLNELVIEGQDSDREVLQGGRQQHIEQVLTLSDGLRRSFDLLKAPLRNAAGQVTGLVVIGRDITHLKQSERIRRKQMEEIQRLNSELESRVRGRTAQLEAANSELEAFSYSVSHDLRTPLRALDGFSRVLIEDYHDILDDAGKDYLQRIRRNSQRMGELIDDLLELSRVSRKEVRTALVSLSAQAEEILQELRAAEPDRKVVWTVQSDMWVDADPGLVRVLLDNLLRNAWKFTRQCENAEIHFSSDEREGVRYFHVRDNGAGFDMAYAGRMFGPFQRLHNSKDYEGTGIGLAIVQRIVRLHGGRVSAEGQLGKGAEFTFSLGG
ncbi:MAG: PAS domain-containing protein [Rhodocyclaceae bacterium]|nr:PAS domain-containing protein [Rhodocyclaceae bacterium]